MLCLTHSIASRPSSPVATSIALPVILSAVEELHYAQDDFILSSFQPALLDLHPEPDLPQPRPDLDLRPWVQALVFCAAEPITIEQIDNCLREALGLTELTASQILDTLDALDADWAAAGMAFRIRAVGGGYQLLTEPAYQPVVEALLRQKARRRLSASMLETLAIIAYKQPITKQAIEQIRGVGCDYAIQKLLEKELIELRGKAETIGRPVLYGTTPRFLHGFGLNELRDLPQLRDVAADEDASPVVGGAAAPVETGD